MTENNYWTKVISMGSRALQQAGQLKAVSVIRNARFEIQLNSHDNWNGGIDYYDVYFKLRYNDYLEIEDEKADIEKQILEAMERFQTNEGMALANVIVQVVVETIVDWNAIAPMSKEGVLKIIEDERSCLESIATGKLSFKDDGVEEEYQERHREIKKIAQRAGFDYPISYNSLVEWWNEAKQYVHYGERRAYLSELFSPIIEELRDASDKAECVDFETIASKTQAIGKAIDDANLFIREGKYDSALDRIHSAVHGYVRATLLEHDIEYAESDTLAQLYTKLHRFYEQSIQPPEVAELIKTAIRSASGIISSLNDLRNRHTVSHPNATLIRQREALLMLRLVSALIDYIETVDRECFSNH